MCTCFKRGTGCSPLCNITFLLKSNYCKHCYSFFSYFKAPLSVSPNPPHPYPLPAPAPPQPRFVLQTENYTIDSSYVNSRAHLIKRYFYLCINLFELFVSSTLLPLLSVIVSSNESAGILAVVCMSLFWTGNNRENFQIIH